MRDERRSGFALVLTLFALALAATALAVAARDCLVTGAHAAAELRRVQERWAMMSCAELLIPRVERQLQREEQRTGRPVSRSQFTLELAGALYETIFSDEQAKVNVNWLDAHARGELASLLESLAGSESAALTVRLFPLEGHQAEAFPRYGCFEQAFPDAGAADLIGTVDEPGPSMVLTCWGDGRINAKRASPQALAVACSRILARPEVDRLVRFKQQHPDADAAELVRAAQTSSERAELIRKLLVDSSACHSLWVVAPGAGTTRLAVNEEPWQNGRTAAPHPPRLFHFVW